MIEKTRFATNNTCNSCRFCDKGDGDSHICRYNPPVTLSHLVPRQTPQGVVGEPMFFSVWHTIRPLIDWCGKHEEKRELQ